VFRDEVVIDVRAGKGGDGRSRSGARSSRRWADPTAATAAKAAA
jgi:hypothetical protein